MGASQSSPNPSQKQQKQQPDILPISPVIQRLRQNLKLKSTGKYTNSFINYQFSLNLKKQKGQINRINSPFIPLQLKQNNKIQQNSLISPQQQIWLTCCLISPLMAITCPKYLIDKTQKNYNKVKMNGLTKNNQIVQSYVIKVFILQKDKICLVVFDRPVMNLGWAGLGYLESAEEIREQPYKAIYFPNRILKKTNKQIKYFDYNMQIKKTLYQYKPLHTKRQKKSSSPEQQQYQQNQQIIGKYKNPFGSIIFKLIKNKPYLIGIQINQQQCRFFDKQIYNKIKQVAENYFNAEKENQVLQKIDIQKFQLMQKI